jgi:hypothetical protein
MKKSFMLHIDSLCVLDDLTNEQRGELFFAIYNHHLAKDIELSPIVKIAFSQFKNQFARDDEKYHSLCEKNRQIALTRHSKPDVTKSTKRNDSLPELPDVTKSTDNKKDSKKDINKKPPLKKPIGFVYDELFEELWGEIKTGDKWNAYRAWITKRDNYRHADLLNVVKMENDKQFGKRHLSTLLNSDIDTMLEDTKPTPSNKPVRYV